jgi:hypothetical protein
MIVLTILSGIKALAASILRLAEKAKITLSLHKNSIPIPTITPDRV